MTARGERVENVTQVVILLLVGGMAGAASFTHVHDWTMVHSPAGTGDWFGWTNALVSELTPAAAGIEVRRRRRNGHPIGFALAVLVAAVALSIAAQFAQAQPSVSGWLLAAVPALGFLALTKLVLGRPTVKVDDLDQAHELTPAAVPTVPAAMPVATPEVASDVVMGARLAAFSHRQSTGQPITTMQLAERFGLDAESASRLLATIGEAPTTPALLSVNGSHGARL